MDRAERNKLYYQNHREDIIKKSKDRQEEAYSIDKHRNSIKQRQKEYYWANREKILNKAKEKRKMEKPIL